MNKLKKCFYRLMPMAIGIAVASCNNTSNVDTLPQQTKLAPPVTEPLKLSEAKKIDFDAIKSHPVKPEVKSFDLAKLPLSSYDTGGMKPVKYRPEIKKFDLEGLPSRPLDIDKLPSAPLKFNTYKLKPPKLIKSGPRRLINSKISVFELGKAQGLNADTITVTYADRDGFVWIGTNRGLYRYDGENFWQFDGLPEQRAILSIQQDKQGLIWLGTFEGCTQVIDIKRGIAKKFDKIAAPALYDVNQMVIDDRQRIWTASWKGGASVIDPQTLTIKYLGTHEGLSGNRSRCIVQDANHNLWIGTDVGGLNFIDLKNKKIRYVDSLHGLKTNIVQSILYDRDGQLWVGQYPGFISVINAKKTSVQTIYEPLGIFNVDANRIYSLSQDKQGRIWVGKLGNGVELIDPENQTRASLKGIADLSSNNVINIAQDKRGQMWVAGFSKLNLIETNKLVLDQIGNTPTTFLFEDNKGLVWRAGDFDGVNILDRQKKTIRTLNSTNGLDNDTMEFIKEYKGKMLITDNTSLYIIDSSRRTMTIMGKEQGFISPTRSWAFDKKGNMWLGGFDTGGMEIYYPGSNTVKLLGKAEGIRDGDIEDMCVDKGGHIWISTFRKGVAVIDPGAGDIQYVDNAVFRGSDQRLLLADNAGNVWVSGRNGLAELNLAKKTLTLFTIRQGLIDNGIITLLQHNDQIYAGNAKGVNLVTPPSATGKNKNWQVESIGAFFGFDKKNGDYQSDVVTKDGLYWMGDLGITVFNLSARDTVSYPPYITGINIMDKPAYFTGDRPSKANGMTWEKVNGFANIPVNFHLPYNQNFMQFHYSVRNTARHDTVWYKYKLIGSDTSWSETTDAASTPNYINLTPGDYTFEVTSRAYNRAWTKPALLSFTINPPWWQTWWAYVLYVILLGGSLWGFSHYRSLQLIKDKRNLEHKVHLRTEEVMQQKEEIETQRDNLEKTLSDLKTTQTQLIQSEKMASLGELTAGIAHEIQNPLNFVNNFSEVNKEMLEELKAESEKPKAERDEQLEIELINDIIQNEQKINHHGKRADSIVKGMLEHSRSRSGQKEPTDINTMADEFLRLSYHGLRSKDKTFNAEFNAHFDPVLPKINVVQQDIGRVLLNLFNNAFYAVNQKQKDAGADYKPEVSVSTSAENGQVIIRVKDNGVGIPDAIKEKIMQPFFTTKPTGEGTGLGLSLTYDMVVKGHRGTIEVNSQQNEYTEFIITLPIN